jgi:preprotein translocase subunit SecD
MLRGLKWKFILYAAITVFAILLILPTLTSQLPSLFNTIIPSEKIRLGLDLQGGMYLLLEVEKEKAIENYVEGIKNDLKEDLKDRGIPFGKLEREKADQIVLEVSGEKKKWETLLSQRYSMMRELSSTEEKGIWKLRLVLDSKEAEARKNEATNKALEIIRNRIDKFGVREPEITLQGSDRILIQLPGEKDPDRAKSLIGRTALLEFKLVDEEGDLEAALKGSIPEGDIVLYHRSVDPKTGGVKKIPYLLKEKTLMTGEFLKDARVAFEHQPPSYPYVSLKFDDRGAKLFEQITGANVKKRLAIILDDNLYSAPVIEERIPRGEAMIRGSFSIDEAKELAIVLQAGALPAPVKFIEERTVGPSLGQDSIRMGIISVSISAFLIVLFMTIYYRVSGLVANVALILNVILVFAVLSIRGLGATLTLPGIAGLVLSIGMAVDANILIHERIKEELRWGKTIRAAIDQGYHRAFSAILDSNVTTLIAAVFLYQFGTGPVRGFAVTLFWGISANMFTAVFVTRWIFDYLTLKIKIKKLSI